MPCSICWVQYNHLQSATVFDKYSWSALKALSEMVTAGELLRQWSITHCFLCFCLHIAPCTEAWVWHVMPCNCYLLAIHDPASSFYKAAMKTTSSVDSVCAFACCCAILDLADVQAMPAGYGKQEPETMIDVWVTMFSLLMGTTMWLILGSIITTLLIHMNAAHSEYTAKMTALSQYMMENNLPQVSMPTECAYDIKAYVGNSSICT